MKNIFLILLAASILFSCRKDDSDKFDGPDLNDSFGPFDIITPLSINSEVDFSAGESVVLSMELSKRTQWDVTITGASTGAKRVFSGNDRILSIDNANWKGGADKFPGFGLEKSYIEISFPNETTASIIKDSITITGGKIDDGYLITDFENGIGTSWDQFNQATVAGGIICSDGNAAKGDCYYSWDGLVGWDWAIGSVMVKPDAGTFNLPNNANNLYFNMAFKALENVGPDNCFILFWFDEDENGDGVFDPATEDRYEYQYWFNTTDWDLVSINYADLQFDADGNTLDLNGNGLPEPSKLVGVQAFFLANKDTGLNSKAYIDQMIFTTDEPYKP